MKDRPSLGSSSDGLLGGSCLFGCELASGVPIYSSCPQTLAADSSGGVRMDSQDCGGDGAVLSWPWQSDFPLPTEPFPPCFSAMLSHIFTPVPF